MWPTQWILAMVGLLLVTSSNAQVCSNGLVGVDNSDVCCVAECGTCGGAGCGRRGRDAGLTADDCCAGRIRDTGVICSDSGAAPCIIDDGNVCSNGFPGLEARGVCCASGCPQCGGSGCGSQAQRVGLSASDCCIGRITSAGVLCSDAGMAPCIIDEVCGPALTITLEWSEIASDLDLFVTEPDGSIVSFARMVGSVGFLDMDVRSGPGIETYTIFRFLDPNSLAILGNYQFQARRFAGPTETVWTLVASLIDVEVLSETGNFTESSRSETFTVSVTDYDPTCEDGTDVFDLGSRDSTSSPEDKLP
ncbi:unnamed protein product [Ascophyllum nodosum]